MTRRRSRQPGRRRSRPQRAAPGAPPGTLAPPPGASPSHIVVRRFGPDVFEEKALAQIDELASLRDPSSCLWVDVTGLADAGTIAAIGTAFQLHDLSLEGALDPAQRGKVNHYEHYIFAVLKTLTMTEHVESHQLSLFFGDRFVVTLQDKSDPALEPVRERLRHARGKIRTRGADYLAYTLIDAVIDHYFPVVERFDDQLESVEDLVLEEQGADSIDLARGARQDLQVIRHAVWPARDVVTALLHEDAGYVTDETRVHLRDCYDHIVQLQEMIESSREIAASLLESYISRVSLRTNEVMKVLTVIATIFIPLTFITGLYGMNFNRQRSPLNMPELDWYWGYPFSLLIMLGTVAGSLLYFRRKGWFRAGHRTRHDGHDEERQRQGPESR